jgi:hypothetical protein
MYNSTPYVGLNGLGLSLKPPDWLTKIVGAVIKSTTVTVPTPAGNVIVDLSDPASIAAAQKILTGTKVSTTVGTKPTTPMAQVNAAVESVPGGWLTVAAVAAGAFLLLTRMMGRRGR